MASVAISEDERWLCTLGNSNDGFILIYSINVKSGSASLYASNKCSNVHSVIWMGSSVITTGTRHVKVWRVDQQLPKSPSKARPEFESIPGSPMPKTFSGRNCILGPLIDSTFSQTIAVSDCKAILCTTQGEICVLDDVSKMQRIELAGKVGFGILCAAFDRSSASLWFGGHGDDICSVSLDCLTEPPIPPESLLSAYRLYRGRAAKHGKKRDMVATGLVRGHLLTVRSDSVIEFRAIGNEAHSLLPLKVAKELPAHGSAVLGVCGLLPKPRIDAPDFLTYSTNGNVLFWTFDGQCCDSLAVSLDHSAETEDAADNELKTLKPIISDDFLVSGDRRGIVR